VSTHLVRNRTLVFSPRAPWSFLSKISQNANKDAGRATGGVRGGMSPCPPLVRQLSPFSDDFAFLAKLRQFLLEVRTFFAENPIT
jgi:hypothetical protein